MQCDGRSASRHTTNRRVFVLSPAPSSSSSFNWHRSEVTGGGSSLRRRRQSICFPFAGDDDVTSGDFLFGFFIGYRQRQRRLDPLQPSPLVSL
jgi:hypothetical protein